MDILKLREPLSIQNLAINRKTIRFYDIIVIQIILCQLFKVQRVGPSQLLQLYP